MTATWRKKIPTLIDPDPELLEVLQRQMRARQPMFLIVGGKEYEVYLSAASLGVPITIQLASGGPGRPAFRHVLKVKSKTARLAK